MVVLLLLCAVPLSSQELAPAGMSLKEQMLAELDKVEEERQSLLFQVSTLTQLVSSYDLRFETLSSSISSLTLTISGFEKSRIAYELLLKDKDQQLRNYERSLNVFRIVSIGTGAAALVLGIVLAIK